MAICKHKRPYKSFLSETDILAVQLLTYQKERGRWLGKEVGYIIPKLQWTAK